MKCEFWFVDLLVRWLPPQKLPDLVAKTWDVVGENIPRQQQVDLIKSAAKRHLVTLLRPLNREERASLMNDLLPLIAREFPLSDLDFLSAFPSPHEERHRHVETPGEDAESDSQTMQHTDTEPAP